MKCSVLREQRARQRNCGFYQKKEGKERERRQRPRGEWDSSFFSFYPFRGTEKKGGKSGRFGSWDAKFAGQ
jgi:hypothetical protein